jgi:hypothetical protein
LVIGDWVISLADWVIGRFGFGDSLDSAIGWFGDWDSVILQSQLTQSSA